MRRWPFPLLAGVALTSTMLVAVTPQAAPQAPATAPAGAMRFTTLPGFTIERLVPAGKTDSYVVLTFDSLGRPVVSKELDHPRLLIDADKDGVYEVGEGVQRRRSGTARASGSTGGRSMARVRPVKPRLPPQQGSRRRPSARASIEWRTPTATMKPIPSRSWRRSSAASRSMARTPSAAVRTAR